MKNTKTRPSGLNFIHKILINSEYAGPARLMKELERLEYILNIPQSDIISDIENIDPGLAGRIAFIIDAAQSKIPIT